jgi:hypothetical protein
VKPVCPEHRSMMRSGCVDTLSEWLVNAVVKSLISRKTS